MLGSSHCAEGAQNEGDLVAQQSALRSALPIDLPLHQLAHVLLEQRNLKLSKVHLSTAEKDLSPGVQETCMFTPESTANQRAIEDTLCILHAA